MFRLIASAVMSGLLTASAYAADKICAPPSLLKIVTEEEIEGAHKGDFSIKPRTLYRSGEKQGRLEQAADPKTGAQLLLVVSEPDVWVADVNTLRGRHMTDTGASQLFRAHVIDNATAVKSAFIRNLEYGCEIQWMKDAGAKSVKIHHATLGQVDKLEYAEGGEHLVLYAKAGRPLRMRLVDGNRQVAAMNYVGFETVKPFDPALFAVPQGIAFAADGSAAAPTDKAPAPPAPQGETPSGVH